MALNLIWRDILQIMSTKHIDQRLVMKDTQAILGQPPNGCGYLSTLASLGQETLDPYDSKETVLTTLR